MQPIWPLPLLTCCQPCLGLFIHGWSISTSSMFGGPQCPKIEIIRTGREKRKSENVSECAYTQSGPPPLPAHPTPSSANLSIHPCYTVSSLFCFLETEAAGRRTGRGGGVERVVCGLDWVAICRWSRAKQSDQVFQITTHTGVLILSLISLSLCLSFKLKHVELMQIWVLDELISQLTSVLTVN